MSRVGNRPIPVPANVQVTIEDNHITVKGPKGQLSRTLHPDMTVSVQDGQMLVARPSNSKEHRSLHGLTRSLIANMVTGVTTGFQKALEVTGVGYRVQKQGAKLVMQLGLSHPVEVALPPGVEIVDVETFTPTTANEWRTARFVVKGIDKEQVGETAAKLRRLRKTNPYTGKGVRYEGERIRRKPGKTAAKAQQA